MRRITVCFILMLSLSGCVNPFGSQIVPNSVAVQQAPNVANATKSAVYFRDNIEEYMKDPNLVVEFATYNAVAWESMDKVYNPSSSEVPTGE